MSEKLTINEITEIVPFDFSKLGAEDAPSIDARLLHQWLEVSRQFYDWIKERDKEFGLLKKLGCKSFVNPTGEKGRPSTEYLLTQEAAMLIASREKTPKSIQFVNFCLQQLQEMKKPNEDYAKLFMEYTDLLVKFNELSKKVDKLDNRQQELIASNKELVASHTEIFESQKELIAFQGALEKKTDSMHLTMTNFYTIAMRCQDFTDNLIPGFVKNRFMTCVKIPTRFTSSYATLPEVPINQKTHKYPHVRYGPYNYNTLDDIRTCLKAEGLTMSEENIIETLAHFGYITSVVHPDGEQTFYPTEKSLAQGLMVEADKVNLTLRDYFNGRELAIGLPKKLLKQKFPHRGLLLTVEGFSYFVIMFLVDFYRVQYLSDKYYEWRQMDPKDQEMLLEEAHKTAFGSVNVMAFVPVG